MKNERILFIASLIAIPFIIYVYFIRWRTGTIYGDDLQMFSEHSRLTSLYDKIHLLVPLQKYRPIQGIVMHAVMEGFQKNIHAYYVFNVAAQTINTFIFAALLNLFLRSPLLALLFSMTLGISRFALFNMTQLLNGGPLEALAMTFFLLSLLYVVKAMRNSEWEAPQKQKAILLSILFANLGMYTHERYIVIFPFIFAVALFFPGLKTIASRNRIALAVICVVSILLNIGIKKYIYSMPFFVGTAGTQMSPSITNILQFFFRAVLSIFQINSGDGYLVGITFSYLPRLDKLFVLFILMLVLGIFGWFILQKWKEIRSDHGKSSSMFFIFIFLWLLFGLMLVPAVSTIRLEQRWLQASAAVFVLQIVIALTSMPFGNLKVRNSILGIFALLFLGTDIMYLRKGGDYFYMVNAEKDAAAFKDAALSGTITSRSDVLYILGKKMDPDTESAYRWFLLDGHLFEFYQGKLKKLIFVDSSSISDRIPADSLIKFDSGKAQLVLYSSYPKRIVTDLTGALPKNMLKVSIASAEKKRKMDSALLFVNVNNLSGFSTDGFYDIEHGFRWTNGNAHLRLRDVYSLKDSVVAELTTFMPPACKNIIPKVTFRTIDSTGLQPISSMRIQDRFIYTFYTTRSTNVVQVNISADTLRNHADKRILSFPFISLQIKKKVE
ncbi:MAG TPA: hypothetical protein VGN00_00950 [Puia sp.]|jgi:hypothetical protein